jgi:hypothetical protein
MSPDAFTGCVLVPSAAGESLRIWANNLLCCALNQSISGVTKTKKAIRIAPQRSSCHSALPPSYSAQTTLKPPSNHLGCGLSATLIEDRHVREHDGLTVFGLGTTMFP